jgi:hypothetical protein
MPIKQDYWEGNFDFRGITTNFSTNSQGLAVMGRGIAYEVASAYPNIPG